MRREIAFANRLPNSEVVRERAEYMLSLCESPDHWTEEIFAEHYMTGAKEALRYLGMPDVLISVTVGFAGWRVAVSRFLRSFRSEQRA